MLNGSDKKVQNSHIFYIYWFNSRQICVYRYKERWMAKTVNIF